MLTPKQDAEHTYPVDTERVEEEVETLTPGGNIPHNRVVDLDRKQQGG